jgi:hypothetical protein
VRLGCCVCDRGDMDRRGNDRWTGMELYPALAKLGRGTRFAAGFGLGHTSSLAAPGSYSYQVAHCTEGCIGVSVPSPVWFPYNPGGRERDPHQRDYLQTQW